MGWKPVGNNFGMVGFNDLDKTIYRSGKLTINEILQYKDQKDIKAMINLRDNLSDKEKQEIRSTGIRLFPKPMSDHETPNPKEIKKILNLIEYLPFNLDICCEGGRHRTGLIAATYLVVYKDFSKEDAWNENKKYNWYDKAFGIFGKDHSPLRKWFFEYDLKSLKV